MISTLDNPILRITDDQAAAQDDGDGGGGGDNQTLVQKASMAGSYETTEFTAGGVFADLITSATGSAVVDLTTAGYIFVAAATMIMNGELHDFPCYINPSADPAPFGGVPYGVSYLLAGNWTAGYAVSAP